MANIVILGESNRFLLAKISGELAQLLYAHLLLSPNMTIFAAKSPTQG